MFTWLTRLAAAGALLVAVTSSGAAWPDKPIRFYVGFTAGGGSDTTARIVAEEMRQRLKVQVIIDNKPGDGGELAMGSLAAAKDGHSFLLFADESIPVPLATRHDKFRIVRDFRPLGMIGEGPYVLVAGQKAPFRTLDEFMKHAQANPLKVRYTTSGSGTQPHLIGEYLSKLFQLGMIHVPSRGTGSAVNELLDGNVPLAIVGLANVLPRLASKELVVLAVASAAREPRLPDVPTLDEKLVPGFVVVRRYGLVAPKSVPADGAARLVTALESSLGDSDLRAKFAALGLTPRYAPEAQYVAKLREEESRWAKFIEKYRLRVD
jgi:tripartite-type tricarboxylate transporter receptor subunit TctC